MMKRLRWIMDCEWLGCLLFGHEYSELIAISGQCFHCGRKKK